MAETQQASDVESGSEAATQPTSEQVNEIIRWHAGYSAVGGLIPVPLLDIAASTTIQIRMISKLCRLYGVPFSEQAVKGTIASLVASVIPAAGVGYMTASAMRWIPLVGPILGFATFPALYAALTWALGRTFAWHFSRGGTLDNFMSDETKDRFRSEFATAKDADKKGRAPSAAAKPA